MDTLFDVDGTYDLGLFNFKDLKLYINIPSWIEERNIYDINTHEQFAVIKPHKFGGLSYRLLDIIDDFAEIETIDYGKCLVKITGSTKITNYPEYEGGNY